MKKWIPTSIGSQLTELMNKIGEFFPIALMNGFRGKQYETEFKKFSEDKEEYFKQKEKENRLRNCKFVSY